MKRRLFFGSVLGLGFLAAGTAGASTLGGTSFFSPAPAPSASVTATQTPADAAASSPSTLAAATTTTATVAAAAPITPTATVTTTAAATPTVDLAELIDSMGRGGGGGSNIVKVVNKNDGRFRFKGHVRLNQITGPVVSPVNYALAQGSCTDCQTYAVALQVNVVSRNVSQMTPENAAIAANINCTRCRTVAVAMQYVHQVDDPRETKQEIQDLVKDLDHELGGLNSQPDVTIEEADARILAVIARYRELNASLREQRDEATESDTPGATPIAEPSTTATPDTTATATVGPSATASPEVPATPAASPTGSPATVAATSTLTPTVTATSLTASTPAGSPSVTSP